MAEQRRWSRLQPAAKDHRVTAASSTASADSLHDCNGVVSCGVCSRFCFQNLVYCCIWQFETSYFGASSKD
jgi:hypothetical protein